MDCEIFDKLVIDRIFLELDDLASGAVQRHVAHCSRCRSIESGLRATREVALLPAVEPPTTFVERVLTIERATRTQLPVRQRLGRAVSVLAAYAMRPQLGMSALLLLMIGSSLFLLRTHPGERELVQVTERGVPEGEVDTPSERGRRNVPNVGSAVADLSREAVVPKLEQAPSISSASSALLDAARRAFAEERYRDAQDLAEKVILGGGAETGAAAMVSALALAKRSGCGAALARFEAMRARHGRSPIGEEAAFHAAECHVETGQLDRARPLFDQLRNSPIWGSRARARLNAPPLSAPTPSESMDKPPTPPSP